MNQENYGTEVSIKELKGHYETHFLTAEQFIDLVKEWHKEQLTLTDFYGASYCDSKICNDSKGNLCNGWCKGLYDNEPTH